MKIKKIYIKKFRGFKNVQFELGSHITVISGQNGTQKTTLLGLLTQPFSISEKQNPMFNETPLSGGNFISAFSEKFKLSEKFDKAGEHEWTLHFDKPIDSKGNLDYTVQSILRDKKKKGIRFWQKGSRSKGSGYVQLPVIFLSLKRVLPIGEDQEIKEVSFTLSDEEKDFYKDWHSKILILTRDQIKESSYLKSTNKQTLGVNTDYYDWQGNSSGQDNISKILLAIMSFKRLKEQHSNYQGGILAIDEVDATFYPGSQIKILEAFTKFASKYDIQIILTTHSLTTLKEFDRIKNDAGRKGQVNLIYLQKEDSSVIIKDNVCFDYIKNSLNLTVFGRAVLKKVDVYMEDEEARVFAKYLLGTARTKHLNFVKISLSCSNLIELALIKIPSFVFPNSIIIVDGDIAKNTKTVRKVNNIKNILTLPTDKSPEQLLASFLDSTPDSDSLWGSIDPTFKHDYCFKDYTKSEILKDRKIAKKWFNSHKHLWGRNCYKVLKPWKERNKELVDEFLLNFDTLFNDTKNKLDL